eukprot:TRINITY_DN8831_c0_g1_i3.p1 TRINITY_DN8831_c0_g1~~TRINITY_DN8831_c0_g1_i3.p1  ORF type:complete len:105 (-),score=34.25 TRINITY_DN8831_c0_g1_i3:4-318(-)
MLYKLDGMTAEDPQYETLFKKLKEHLDHHHSDEETKDLPRLEEALGAEESKKLAIKFERYKKIAPTHPHPGMPDDGGLFQTAAALALAPIDKIRDWFETFPDKE